MISVKRLDKTSLQDILKLSIEIFHPTPDELERYHGMAQWTSILDQGGVMLGAYSDAALGGFMLTRRDSPTHYHIWHAGVLPIMRGQGLMKQLMIEMEAIARADRVTLLTANTFKEKFPIMYELLPRYGFILDHEDVVDTDGRQITKSFFKRTLQ